MIDALMVWFVYGLRRWEGTLVADAPQAGAELNELTLIQRNQSNLQLFPRNVTSKSRFTHMCPAKIFVSVVYLLDQNKPRSCSTHVMAHYCSKHTSY